MKKTTPKNKPKKQTKLPRIVYHLLGLLTILVAIWLADIITGALEKQKFISLKQDMLAIQSEFNKIDAGWEYRESCHAKGGKFESDQAGSCYINVFTLSQNIEFTDRHHEVLKKYGLNEKTSSKISANNVKFPNSKLYSAKYSAMRCSVYKTDVNQRNMLGVECYDLARVFYFPRSQ